MNDISQTFSKTQRAIIEAVHSHPLLPKSTNGVCSEFLMAEAERQAFYQASVGRQGHQHWEKRFQEIISHFKKEELSEEDLVPVEVCAESWPGENLEKAAASCVHSWYRSTGHWKQVYRYQPLWGYDMKRSENGIWYATGIFGNKPEESNE
jgi:hypothetical protein